MYNSGIELELGVNIFNERNFKWDVNLNFSTLKNRITMIHPDKKISSLYDASGKEYKGYNQGNFFIAEDLSMFTWRAKEFAGIGEDGQSLWYKDKKDKDGNRIGGRETTDKYADADYYVTNESSIPDFYGGFDANISAYGFDFSINCSYRIGGKQYDGTYAHFMSSPTGSTTGYNFHADLLDSWTPEKPSASIPRFMFGDTYS